MQSVGQERKQTRSVTRQIDWTLPGFGPMTRISTSFGDVPAQALRERDMIRTHEGKLHAVQWVDRVRLDSEFFRHAPDAHAILIRAGSMGQGLPKADIIVSPEQLLGLGRHAFSMKFVQAKSLLGRPGVIRKPEDIMTYTMFHCGISTTVRVEGVWAKVDP